MTSERDGFLTGVISLALSAALNGALIYGVDHAVSLRSPSMERLQKEALARQAASELQFEFVEAPPKTRVRSPKEPKKISDHDALNQDALGVGRTDKDAPTLKTEGPADQLAQKRGEASTFSPELAAQPPRAPQKAVPAGSPRAQDPLAPPPVEPRSEKPLEEPAHESTEVLEKSAAPPPIEALPSGSDPRPAVQPREAVPPSAASASLSGQDKIDTEEMAKARSKGALLRGLTSFEATGSGMGEYMKNLKDKLWLKWFPYLSFKYPSDFKSAEAVLRIRLDKNGEVKSVVLIDNTGSDVFATFCIEAVQRASPYGPLPEEILALVGQDGLEITFAFHYY